jgi:hypothetical protein
MGWDRGGRMREVWCFFNWGGCAHVFVIDRFMELVNLINIWKQPSILVLMIVVLNAFIGSCN